MAEWWSTTLGEVADEVTVGFVGTMAHEYRPAGIPFLRSQNVLPHRIDVADVKYVDEDFHHRLRKSALRAGDVVTVRTGKPGTSAVVPESLEGANCADLVITRPGPKLDARWLAYYMNGAAEAFISAHLVGAVQQHFNVGAAKALDLSLPPLAEQRAIAEVLGALDDKIAANTRLAAAAEGLAQSVFVEAALDVPVVPMSSLLTPILGGTPSRSDPTNWGGRNLWASARDITAARNGIVIETDERITDRALSSSRTGSLPRGSVILTARGTVGAVARLAEPASINQSCYGFVPGALPPALLYFGVLQAAESARAMAHGSVFDTITMRTLDDLTVPAFSPADRPSLETRLGPLLNVVEAMVREDAHLAATRDALLPALMSGRIRVRDVARSLEEVL